MAGTHNPPPQPKPVPNARLLIAGGHCEPRLTLNVTSGTTWIVVGDVVLKVDVDVLSGTAVFPGSSRRSVMPEKVPVDCSVPLFAFVCRSSVLSTVDVPVPQVALMAS